MVRLCGPCACSTAPWSHSTSTWRRGMLWCATAPRTRPQRPRSLCTCKPLQSLLHQKLRKRFLSQLLLPFCVQVKQQLRRKKMGNTWGKPNVSGVLMVFSHAGNSSAFWMSTDDDIFVSGQSHGRGGRESCCIVSQLYCNVTAVTVITKVNRKHRWGPFRGQISCFFFNLSFFQVCP